MKNSYAGAAEEGEKHQDELVALQVGAHEQLETKTSVKRRL